MFRNLVNSWLAPRKQPSRCPAVRAVPRRPALEVLEDRTLLTTFFVSDFRGNDLFGNGSAAAPYKSIQRAADQAVDGDAVEVTGGVYTYFNLRRSVPGGDNVLNSFGTTAVVDVVNKHLALQGSFDQDFLNQDLVNTPSVIDGAIPGAVNQRGVFVSSATPGGAGVAMDSFVIQDGLGLPIPRRTQLNPADTRDAIDGKGGGMLAENAVLLLSNLAFINNTALGQAVPGGVGGVGVGGGLAIFSGFGNVALSNLSFLGNAAVGGAGDTAGGIGQGGGLFTDSTTFTGGGLFFGDTTAAAAFAVPLNNFFFDFPIPGNTALGGPGGISASGPGSAAAQLVSGNGFGGGANFETITGPSSLTDVVAANNTAVGGDAPNGTGGAGEGAGIEVELGGAPLTLTGATIQGNTAQGGSGPFATPGIGSLGTGGGIEATNSDVVIDSSSISNNTARGGNGGSLKGSAVGGGINAVSTNGVRNSFVLTNSQVNRNLAQFGNGQSEVGGGSGGGLSLNGSAATVTSTSFSGNAFGNAVSNLQGQAVAVNSALGLGTVVTFAGDTITNHVNTLTPTAAAIDVFPGNVAAFNRNHFAGNSKDTNADGSPNPPGVFNGLGTNF